MELKKMNLEIRKYTEKDLTEIIRIWNDEISASHCERLFTGGTGTYDYLKERNY